MAKTEHAHNINQLSQKTRHSRTKHLSEVGTSNANINIKFKNDIKDKDLNGYVGINDPHKKSKKGEYIGLNLKNKINEESKPELRREASSIINNDLYNTGIYLFISVIIIQHII